MAIANGAVLPLMCIVFGDMTDSLINGVPPNMTEEYYSEFPYTHLRVFSEFPILTSLLYFQI